MHLCKSLFLHDCPSLGLLRFIQTCCGTVASSNFPPPSSPVLNTLTHTSSLLTSHPPLPRHILDPFPHIFEALPSWTPQSDSQRGPLQSIREVIHTLPHLSYLLYYHPGWPIPCSYPLRPGAQAGYPGFQQDWQCPPTAPPPLHPPPHYDGCCHLNLQLAQYGVG